MKENELRLNNLVMVNYKTDLLSKVTWIQEGSINVIFDRQPDLVNGVVCSVNDLIPIPLTEEWLLKAGFEKSFKNDYWFSIKIGDKRLLVSILGNIEIEKWDRTMINFLSICQYIHQLQNLYFSLCGEELVFSSTEP